MVDRIVTIVLPDKSTLNAIQQTPLNAFDDMELAAGDLSFECVSPLQTWRLVQQPIDFVKVPPHKEVFSSLARFARGENNLRQVPVSFDVTFKARMPAVRIPTDVFAPFVGGDGRLEQAGRLSGVLRIGDAECQVMGTGARDRSWGVRDWLSPTFWYWITLQWTEPDMFVHIGNIGSEMGQGVTGFVYHGDQLTPIVNAKICTEHDPDTVRLLSGEISLSTESGKKIVITLDPQTYYHLVVSHNSDVYCHVSENLVHCTGNRRGRGRGVLEYGLRREASHVLDQDSLDKKKPTSKEETM